MSRVADRPTYRLMLRPEPGVSDAFFALKWLLKRVLRDHGLRCLRVEQVEPDTATKQQAGAGQHR